MASIPNSPPGALLELKLVGAIKGRFFVARYQRGYRWGRHEVECLLEDIWRNGDRDYCLQPVVVKRRDAADEWELVDGQQRLTTLFLILTYMQRAVLQNATPGYSITYETRPDSEDFLRRPESQDCGRNIDFFHIHEAYRRICDWFEAHGERRHYVANRFYSYLYERVRVIWYEAPPRLDATTLFTRLNVGRIPLTDAELVKALLLSRSGAIGGQADRSHELAAQWDAIERDLHHPDLWAFVTRLRAEDSPTRITLLLDAVAGKPAQGPRPRFHTFETLQARIRNESADRVWNEVVDLHARLLGWFDDRSLYHKIGFLIADGLRFADLVALAKGQTRSGFERQLDELIRRRLDLCASDVAALAYDTATGRDKCERVLLLMNVEAVRRVEHSAERYPFRLHKAQQWSLEHIHAQHAEGLNKVEQWREWLRLHREALRTLPVADAVRRDELVQRIDATLQGDIDRARFEALASEVAGLFGPESQAQALHSITNLALLSCGDNSALGNAVFEVKRRRVLALDREGAYIPPCTRHVFLKYFTGADAQQVHFWSLQDRESYLSAMIDPDRGLLRPYLKPEEAQA